MFQLIAQDLFDDTFFLYTSRAFKKIAEIAGEVLVALGAPKGHSWAHRAKFFTLEPSNWTPVVRSTLYLSFRRNFSKKISFAFNPHIDFLPVVNLISVITM